MSWTRDRLQDVARTRLDGLRLIVVANREPYIHINKGERIDCMRPAGGLTTALDPVMRACGGVWVAHGSGSADRETSDERGRLAVPPGEPCYTLRRLWLSEQEEEGYYYGFANNALWPLCHQAYCRPEFDPSHWEIYRDVNQRFADAVLEEAGDGPAIVFVQDYHFALLPRFLKQARPDLLVAQFWHIPWPNPETFSICPWTDAILDGMLGNDLLGFHVQYHCLNFRDTVDRTLESRIDAENFTIHRNGGSTRVRPFPISLDPDLAGGYMGGNWQERVAQLRREWGLGNRPLIVSVDRMDYTKGIPERLRAVDRMLQRRPEMRGQFHLVQIGAPSRTHLPAYQRLDAEVEALTRDVNARHGTDDWKPVIFRHEHVGPDVIYPLYRAAAGCVVSSLHDGMNLVAKEFISARDDEQGVLVLSRFTGAARELPDATLVNPFDVGKFAEALHLALTMPADEQRERMQRMRRQVIDHNIYRWAGMLLSEAVRLWTPPRWPSPPTTPTTEPLVPVDAQLGLPLGRTALGLPNLALEKSQ
jgi:trehalose 6-phosphate synthase